MGNTVDKRKLNAGNFVRNNGLVLRTINILRYEYNKLRGVQNVLENQGVSEDEFLDSINFLAEEEYIKLRTITSKENASLADYNFEMIEAKLAAKGIRLLAGGIDDNMIEV